MEPWRLAFCSGNRAWRRPVAGALRQDSTRLQSPGAATLPSPRNDAFRGCLPGAWSTSKRGVAGSSIRPQPIRGGPQPAPRATAIAVLVEIRSPAGSAGPSPPGAGWARRSPPLSLASVRRLQVDEPPAPAQGKRVRDDKSACGLAHDGRPSAQSRWRSALRSRCSSSSTVVSRLQDTLTCFPFSQRFDAGAPSGWTLVGLLRRQESLPTRVAR